MVTAMLARQEMKVPLCVIAAGPGAAEMYDRGQVLLLLERCRPISDRFCDVTVEVGGGQFDRMAWDDSGVEAVEPTRTQVVPWPVFDNDMIVDTVTLPFLKRAVRNLEHADRRRGRLVPFQGIRRNEAPSPVRSRHGVTGSFGLGQGGEQFRRHNGCRMCLKQCAVFSPCLAGTLGQCIFHRKKEFRWFVERVIAPINPQQDNEEKKGADPQSHRRWCSADCPEEQAEILPPTIRELRRRSPWLRTAGGRSAGMAAWRHVGRVTENR